MTTDHHEIARTLRLFVAPGDIGEMRVIGRGAPFGIYFKHDDIEAASQLAATYSLTAKGTYLVMNSIDSALGTRPRLIDTNTLTKDADIIRRNWLLMDFDPSSSGRGANDSATDAEKETARLRMEESQSTSWLRDLPLRTSARHSAPWRIVRGAHSTQSQRRLSVVLEFGDSFDGSFDLVLQRQPAELRHGQIGCCGSQSNLPLLTLGHIDLHHVRPRLLVLFGRYGLWFTWTCHESCLSGWVEKVGTS